MERRNTRRNRRVGALTVGAALTFSPLVAGVPTSADAPLSPLYHVVPGDRGDAVVALQRALIDHGMSVAGGVDGVFGVSTQRALESFQHSIGLAVTGTLDAPTAIALGLAVDEFYGLAAGSSGATVMNLQQRLGFAGVIVEGDAPGSFGAGTTAAVEAFQRSIGLTVTGSVDAVTALALRDVSSAPSGVDAPRPESGGANAVGVADQAGSPTTAADVTDSADVVAASDRPSGGDIEAGIGDGAATDDGASRKPVAGEGGDVVGIDGLVGLRIGARGPAVEQLQRMIIEAGFTVVGGADGIFGALTSNALRSFQHAHGLDGTGVVDVATAEALAAAGTGTPADTDDDAGDADHDPTAGSSSPLQGLRFGSVGTDVRVLQQTLIDLGVEVRGGADGRFGSMTLAALRAFQEGAGLEPTGVVDADTAAALSGAQATTPHVRLLGLRAGALGQTVQELQRLLIDLGVEVRGGADGIFGPATAAALREFQHSQQIEATGRVDRATIEAFARPRPMALRDPAESDGQTSDDGGDGHDHDHDHSHDHGAGDGEHAGAAGWPGYGERGDRVAALQQALVDAGIELRGGVDGVFGGATSAAVMEYQRRTGLSVTGRVDGPTAAALGLAAAPPPEAPDASTVNIEVFPVQGVCDFSDTWGAARSGGRSHQGTDIMAAEGRLLYAVTAGVITKVYVDYPGALAGNGVRLTTDDGTYFFYAHMSTVADGIEVGTRVQAGDVVGYVGGTGNAGAPHLHLEVHPQGGAAVNPYPLLKPIDACHVTTPRG